MMIYSNLKSKPLRQYQMLNAKGSLLNVAVSRHLVLSLHVGWSVASSLSRRHGAERVLRMTSLEIILALLPTWKVAFFARHDPSRMYHIEDHESEEHGQGIEDVLVGLVIWDLRVQAGGIFD